MSSRAVFAVGFLLVLGTVLPSFALEHSKQIEQYWKTGTAAYGDGNLTVAIDCFTRMLQLFPAGTKGDRLLVEAHRSRALAYVDSAQPAKAIEDYQWCLKENPSDEAAWFDCAQVYEGSHLFEKAAAAYAKSVALKPGNADSLDHLARALTALKKYPEAIAQYDQMLKLTPEDEEVWRKRADVDLLSGKFKEAVADYSTAIKYDPDTGWYYNYRAHAYEKLGEKALAEKDRQKAKSMHFQERPADLVR